MTTVKLPSRSITLLAVPREMNLTEALLETLSKVLAEQGTSVLILSNQPIRHFVMKAKESGFDLDTHLSQKHLIVVDCLSHYVGDQGGYPNIFYTSSPSDLSELALTTSEAISSAPPGKGEKWMILDSVSTLLLYNTAGGILRFLHFLISKMRVLEFGGVIIVVRQEASDPMVQSLSQYCDNVIAMDSRKVGPKEGEKA